MLNELIPENADWVVHEPIEVKRPMGRGGFATVHEAIWKGSRVAAKMLHDIYFDPDVVPAGQRMAMLSEFVRECNMQAKMRHPNIVPLYGVYIPDGDGRQPPVLLLELMFETLRERIQREPRLTFRDVIDLALQISSGLRFLHERDQPIGHRDLSAKNVLLSESGACKISDVGLAKVFTPAARVANTAKPGAEPYMPSEVLVPGGQHTEKLDVFSLGVLLLEMLLGHEPRPSPELSTVEEIEGREARFPIAETQRRRVELNELGANHPLRPLIERLLQRQANRPAIGEVYAELKRLEFTDQYQRSPSTFSQGGGGLNVSAQLDQLTADIARRQTEQNATYQQLLQATVVQIRESSEQQMQQFARQLQTVTDRLQRIATRQQVEQTTQQYQAVTERLQQTATRQQLQEWLNQLEERVLRSVDQRLTSVTSQLTEPVQNLSISRLASGTSIATGSTSTLTSQPAQASFAASAATGSVSSSASKPSQPFAETSIATRSTSTLTSQPAQASFATAFTREEAEERKRRERELKLERERRLRELKLLERERERRVVYGTKRGQQ